jgi:hypothetical protein
MTKQQFFKCLNVAKTPEFEPLPYLGVEMVEVFSAPLKRGRREVSFHQAASQIYWESKNLDGSWSNNLESILEEVKTWSIIDFIETPRFVVWYENGNPDGSPNRAFFDFEHDAKDFAALRLGAEIERLN